MFAVKSSGLTVKQRTQTPLILLLGIKVELRANKLSLAYRLISSGQHLASIKAGGEILPAAPVKLTNKC